MNEAGCSKETAIVVDGDDGNITLSVVHPLHRKNRKRSRSEERDSIAETSAVVSQCGEPFIPEHHFPGDMLAALNL